MNRHRLQTLSGELLDMLLGFAEGRGAAVRRTVPRWLGRLVVAGFALLILELLLGGGDVLGTVATSLLTALAVGGAAYVWFYSWTSERATRRVRADARRRPELLFPTPPRIGSPNWVRGRNDLIADISTSLERRFGAGPQVIVGDTGAGKTTLLLGLADHLAKVHDVLPVVVSLRGREEIDFTELAKQSFRESIDPYLRSDDEAEKLWRWMYRGNRIAVLADDLDRAELDRDHPDPHKSAARAAIEAARRRQLPLVVTSRREGVPPDLVSPPIELPPLNLTAAQARDYVLERAGRHSEDDVELVSAHVERGRLLDSPFYLEVLARLVRLRLVPGIPPVAFSEHRVRVALLGEWRESLLGDRSVPVGEKQNRRETLARLDEIASAHLEPTRVIDPEPAILNDLRAGLQLGVVEIDEDGAYRFAHEIVHAYFAAQVLARSESARRRVIDGGADAPRVQLALILAAADPEASRFAAAISEELVSGSDRMPDQQRLLRATAAGEVARAAGNRDPALAERVAAASVAAMPAAAPVAKRAALDQLAGLSGRSAVEALWRYAGDADYGVRWRAAELLVARCSSADWPAPTAFEAYKVIRPRIESQLAEANACLSRPEGERPDDWDPEILPLKHMAWMLPALVTGAADDDARDAIRANLRDLLELDAAGVTAQRGLEASIAQGFKVDAYLRPADEIRPEVVPLLQRSQFWYSRMNLMHAIAIRLIAPRADGQPQSAAEALKELEAVVTREEHPFARAAGRLCLTAAKAAQNGRQGEAAKYIWDDEGVVVSARPRDLMPEAIQLVGDIAVLLNLNETGSVEQRQAFGETDTLPFCMSRSTDRRELFDTSPGCHDCSFHLCPFRQTPGASAHREISRAFCNHQRLYADHRLARHWGSDVRRRALSNFWAEMETLA
ncbi:MAG: hypothetical protein ACJ768_12910 [Gaiellaceae bacterium]